MANTYTLISSNVLSSTAASVTFSAIPATYTDLVVRITARGDNAVDAMGILVNMNGSATSYSYTYLLGNGAASSSGRGSAQTYAFSLYATGATATSNTFGSLELYFPSYTGSASKVVSSYGVTENNATTARIGDVANLWQNSAAITSIVLAGNGGNFVSGSSFYLYGIKNS